MTRKLALDSDFKPVRRVLLKLSGEAFGGGNVGVSTKVLKDIADQVKRAQKEGVQISIVVGGGNFFRGQELQDAGIDRSRGDYMGMLGTVMNAIALQDFLEQAGVKARVQTAIKMGQIAESYIPLKAISKMNAGAVIIFGAGAGLPYFSTDTVSIQRALETNSVEVLMGKNGVDGVYDSDPRTNPNAKKFDKITLHEAIEKDLKVMDVTALGLAEENGINIRVFGIDEKDSVYKALIGEKIGTIVSKD